MSSTTRPLQQQPSNVRLVKRLVNSRTKSSSPRKNQSEVAAEQDEQLTVTPPVKRPSPILKKISSFDSTDGFTSPVTTENGSGGLEYQSPLGKDGLIMDPPTPLFFSFTYGLYSDGVNGVSNGHSYGTAQDEELSSSCGSSTVDDPSPPPRTAAVVPVVEVGVSESKKKKKVTFAVPEAVTFTEKEFVAPSPRLSPHFPHFAKSSSGISSSFSSSSSGTSNAGLSPRATQPSWKRQSSPKSGRIAPEVLDFPADPGAKKRCSWITSKSDPAYTEYHDSEWGVPVHDDKMLFELLVLAGAQAEQSWSEILSKREHYRAAFAGFDAEAVSKFDEEKLSSLEADPEILQHEGKLRQIVDNAKCIVEVVQEFGSLDKFMWNFFSQKPIINRYKTPQQVPIKSAKSDYMSRELMKRGFRFVGPTIMYSFMQAAGMTNDHVVHCFRHEECIAISINPPDQSSSSSTSSSSSDSENHKESSASS